MSVMQGDCRVADKKMLSHWRLPRFGVGASLLP
jgi:hypothetical protein